MQSPPRPTSREIAHAKAVAQQKEATKKRKADQRRKAKKQTEEEDEDEEDDRIFSPGDSDSDRGNDDDQPGPGGPSGQGHHDPQVDPDDGDDENSGGSADRRPPNIRRNPYSPKTADAASDEAAETHVFVVPAQPPPTRKEVFGNISDLSSTSSSGEEHHVQVRG